MTERIIQVSCTRCKNSFQTIMRNGFLTGYTKCPYCGKLVNKNKRFIRYVK
jgi:DNA-directed RNA polymerase subunit RPC12/RpoP